MTKRVFVGVPITDNLGKLVKQWTDENIAEEKIRIIAKKNLHITLVAPWYESEIGLITKKLQQLKIENSFKIYFNKVNYGPNRKKPRLIWVESLFSKELLDLKQKCNQLLLPYTKPDNHTFLPHLTIARFNPKDFGNFKNKEIGKAIDWEMNVDRLNLYESRLSPNGATYVVISDIIF